MHKIHLDFIIKTQDFKKPVTLSMLILFTSKRNLHGSLAGL